MSIDVVEVVIWRESSVSGGSGAVQRSEERFSRNAETEIVCRLMLEKKNSGQCGSVTERSRSTVERDTRDRSCASRASPLVGNRSYMRSSRRPPISTLFPYTTLFRSMSIDVVEVVIWRESSVSGGSGAVQ